VSYFKILVSDEAIDDPDDPYLNGARGKITIGDFCENIFVNLFTWNQDRYRQQRKRAVARLVAGEKRSALIAEYVEYVDPPILTT
jgi:hypothetical protein